MSMSSLTSSEVNEISYVVMDAVLFAFRNSHDLMKIADEFCSGSFSDAVKLCMENGMNNMLTMCDMAKEEEYEKTCWLCGHPVSEHKDSPFGPICPDKKVKG